MAGLEKIIAPELIAKAISDAGKQNKRTCSLTHEVMIWVVLAMGLFTDLPIRQVFKACRRLRRGEESPARSSLCMARQRLGSEPLVNLHQLVVKPLANEQTPGAFYRGMQKVAIDSTVLDVPDCDAHRHLGRSSGGRGEGPFPQVRKVSLVELGTHVEFAFVYGGWKDSEKQLVEQLWDDMQKTHQDPCRAEKTTNLRSETTDGLKQELYAMSLGHFVIRAMMLQAAGEAGIDVDRLSFKGSFQIIKTRLPECDPSNDEKFSQWFEALIWEISRERIPARRNRINPRVIKRKMSRWNKCRPHHRKQPPLTQLFEQTIVMLH